MENNSDESKQIDSLIHELEIGLPNEPSEALSGVIKMLKDLLNTLAMKDDGKRITQYLDDLAQQNPHLSDLLNSLRALINVLKNDENIDMDEFAKVVKELFNRLKKKGTVSYIVLY